MLENQGRAHTGNNYPPFNIEKLGSKAYRITLAVTGFKSEDIDITAQQNLLVIEGKKSEKPVGNRYLHVGIAQRGFERRFELADYVKVKSAGLEDGMLIIDLEREVPAAMQPTKIAIEGHAPLTVVDGDDSIEAA